MKGRRGASGGDPMERTSRRGPIRWRTLRRRVLFALVLAAVPLSMGAAVRRAAHARRLSHDLEALNAAERVTRERLGRVTRRADSLSSRGRIRSASAELGLRPATDGEITFLEDVGERPEGTMGTER